jgi:hypothetical protein
MVVSTSSPGLIATVRPAATPTLDDVAASCGWPVLLGASPRRVQRELSALNPECVLFWLDDVLAIEATARLIAWSRQRGARPLRVAAVLDPDDAVEAVLRAAGAHGFLTVSQQSAPMIAHALSPLLADTAPSAAGHRRRERGTVVAARPFAADHVRPP